MPVPISRDAVAGTKTRIKKIIERLATIHPDAKPDLDFSSALELLIALILAAQAESTSTGTNRDQFTTAAVN
jgi:endonuclease III